MHVSEVEKMRLEKEHKMRHGYQIQDNSRFPHEERNPEAKFLHKDTENKHAGEQQPHSMERMYGEEL